MEKVTAAVAPTREAPTSPGAPCALAVIDRRGEDNQKREWRVRTGGAKSKGSPSLRPEMTVNGNEGQRWRECVSDCSER